RGQVRVRGAHDHVEGLRHGGDDLTDGREVAQPRRVEHVGARLGESLQALDRIVEVAAPVEEVLGARGEGEREGQRTRDLGGRGNALDREVEIVDGLAVTAGRVLDRPAYHAGFGGHADDLGRFLRIFGVAVFQV